MSKSRHKHVRWINWSKAYKLKCRNKPIDDDVFQWSNVAELSHTPDWFRNAYINKLIWVNKKFNYAGFICSNNDCPATFHLISEGDYIVRYKTGEMCVVDNYIRYDDKSRRIVMKSPHMRGEHTIADLNACLQKVLNEAEEATN